MAPAGSTLETVWRTHRVRLIAALSAAFRDLDLAEEALAEAVLAAHASWADAAPLRPEAWLYRTAHRKGLDRLRQRGRDDRRARDLVLLDAPGDAQMPDARLMLFFSLTHPALSAEAQSALMLFHLAGLSAPVIARQFLVSDDVMHQRLKRAREKLAHNAGTFTEPPRAEWPGRLPSLLTAIEVLYGYAHADLLGGTEMRAFGTDALQLAETLAALLPEETEVQALAAMLFYCEARRPARLDASGRLVPLSEQSLALWDASLLIRAAHHLNAAARAVPLSALPAGPFALRAQIQSAHTVARMEYRPHTDELISLYAALLAIEPSPVVEVNYALSLAERDGAAAGLARLLVLNLPDFAPWHLACAELSLKGGDRDAARAHFTAAIPLITGLAERAFVEEKLARL